MKIAVLGATGWIGGTVAAEVQQRGHELIALVRDPAKFTLDAEARRADSLDPASLAQALEGVELLIASIGGRASGRHDMVAESARALLEALPRTGVKRLLWVGGAGSLEVAPGTTLLSLPDFPAEYKDEALAQGQALDVFCHADTPVDWTFVSPAAEIFPGERSGHYRLGGDQLLTDAEGHSRISVQDYAKALVDEAEAGQHPRRRIGVAY
ncbi:NAD(P)-dependent oxidoreductase [Zobellella iuensis]|uniref:NAD(P)-dependent oxidoreductase n=1 Tax=Zobellella iuensis TaxID=2803811 RepID=A0ABS1QMU9_9GAMM|nr:NAD(P)-dependent oxidoreductase [Zobellella iuensis]MBL1376181.1 NAD(P)-dependent oxidoreductase [Zobellella iuensis]